jgi:hypothetical protein
LAFSKTHLLPIERLRVLFFVLVFPTVSHGLEIRPKAGFSFDYFGETYQVTDDRDTVTTVNDYGATVGVVMTGAPSAPSRLRADAELYYGHESSRARLFLHGEYHQGANSFSIDQDAIVRLFHEGGDYSLSSDSFQDSARLSWERRLSESTSLRLLHHFEAVVYSDPDQYNLNSFLQRPGVGLRQRFGLGSEARAAYHIGWRDVPDSSELDLFRHTADVEATIFTDRFSFDISDRLERRIYDDPSPRESSWENRSDGTFDWLRPGKIAARAQYEVETVEYDEPDDLDFNFTRLRVTAGPLLRTDAGIDVSLGPLFGMLYSKTAPAENYNDWAVELGLDIRFGRSWISLTDEFGRRDYEREASATVVDFVNTQAAPPEEDALYSDSTYNRLTALVSSDVGRSITFHLFVNWEPENHRLDRYDSDSRIVSGSIEYRF